MSRRFSSLFIPLLTVTVAIILVGSVNAQSDSVGLNTDDGPHLFWQDDSTAHVFYCCDDEIVSERMVVGDTLMFDGMCQDSGWRYEIVRKSHQVEPDQIDGVSRIFTVSDVHGDYEHLVEILQANGVVDQELHWSWDDGHLVVLGDVFDRGEAVTECLWLIYLLEREAEQSGGAVHFLLGNHELMVLRGDLRYVNDRYLDGISRRARIPYDEMYSAETELGRWLRSKNTVMRINGLLFVHGGLTVDQMREFGGMSEINQLVRTGLDYSAQRLRFDDRVRALYGSLGPLWYRGFIYGIEDRYEAATDADVDSVLQLCGAQQVVVGHCEQDSLAVLHEGRVIAVDVDVEALDGQQALLWEEGVVYRVDNSGNRKVIEVVQETLE